MYTRHPQVRLFLNGRNVHSTRHPSKLVATFKVAWEPGELRAVALDEKGAVVANRSLFTAGAPTALSLTSHQRVLAANRQELAYVTARVLDSEGVVVPMATHTVSFSVVGPRGQRTGRAELAAVGSGDPSDPSSFQSSERRAYRGICVAIVRPGTARMPPRAGSSVLLVATAPGLRSANLSINIR